MSQRECIVSESQFLAEPLDRRHRAATAVCIATSLFFTCAAIAQPVTVSVPTEVGPTDTTISGIPLATAQITVQGTTLTINGRHSIASLSLIRGITNQPAVLTHAFGTSYDYSGGALTDVVEGCALTVTGDVNIQGVAAGGLVASRIDVSSRGFPSDTGPGAGQFGDKWGGGAGHGGSGCDGRSDDPYALGGGCYGSPLQPARLGSGGGFDPNTGASGGAGGGAMKLIVGGTLTNSGAVYANAQNGTGNEAGGGSGGSVWISAPTLAGNGVYQAIGGAASSVGGNGGGGRIAIYYTSFAGAGTLDARCSAVGVYTNNGKNSGAGTIFLKQGAARGTVYFDNGLIDGENSGFSGPTTLDANVILRNYGKLGPSRAQSDFNLTIQGDLTLTTTGFVDGTAKGLGHDQGPGAGLSGYFWGGGAGYGGAGGDGRSDDALAFGGNCYGTPFQPIELGSGGGSDPNNNSAGGAGGGAIRLVVNGALNNGGSVRVNGQGGTGGEAGGGSGGSLWISATTLSGSGTYQALGGSASSVGGNGAGGRIAIYYTSFTGAGTLDARCTAAGFSNNVGGTSSGAGTLFLKQGTARGTIYVDNGFVDGENTEFYVATTLDANVVVRNNGKIGPFRGQDNFDLTILGDLTLTTNGFIEGNSRGFQKDQGPGAGLSGLSWGGGAGHGGAGGDGRSDDPFALGGNCYGSPLMPTMLGSGGGSDPNNNAAGGAGGGAIRLTVNGNLANGGTIRVNGQSGQGGEAGGGSGGSLWISAGTISGNGVFQALGGSAWSVGGNGGGGRLAIYYGSFSGAGTLDARCSAIGNNSNGTNSGAGTLYLQQGTSRGTIYIDNGSIDGENTEFYGPTTLDANMVVRNSGKLGPAREQTDFDLSILGDLTIAANGLVQGDYRGYARDQGPGAGHTGAQFGGGGGYGGKGGNGRSDDPAAVGGASYGSPLLPIDLGSGGASASGYLGGRGGGVITLAVNGTLRNDGLIAARGQNADRAGGGSGGSVRIKAGSLSGTGQINADGGSTNYGGGGGGGRIAIRTCNLSLPLASIHANGGSGGSGSFAGFIGSVSTLSDPVDVTGQPTDVSVCQSSPAVFAVSASSGGTVSYQWQFKGGTAANWTNLDDGVNIAGGSLLLYATGAKSASLSINRNRTGLKYAGSSGWKSNGQVRCLVSSAGGCSDATSIAANLLVCVSDINCDTLVDDTDFSFFVVAYNILDCADPSMPVDCASDLNGDGIVDDSDFSLFVVAYNTLLCP